MTLANQPDLFLPSRQAGPVSYDMPDGEVLLFKHLFNRSESDLFYNTLLVSTKWQQDKIKLYGKAFDLPRLTAWYGDSDKTYTYSGIPMRPLAWTPELLRIKQRIEEEAETVFSSVLLNQYRTGQDSVSWHSDNEKELGNNPIIGSVSFGETRMFQMRHLKRKDLPRLDIPLSHGSFLLMRGPTQHHWEHQIPKTARAVKPRINLTFRVIR
ncbi:MAG: alpha-ketoglutarate-dependent dioxygenase AlkB family protein [Methylophilaceae bacterium]